jgi:low affinity Fe/Cu permease
MATGIHSAKPKPGKSLINRIGCSISEAVADIAAEPLAQLGLVAVCAAWFWLRLPVEILTAFLSILAITLTQMVLNKQKEREVDAHRRDLALHAKIDELVHASKRARDEIAGIEELEEEEIERLRHAVPAAVTAPPSRRRSRAAKPPRAAAAASRPRR